MSDLMAAFSSVPWTMSTSMSSSPTKQQVYAQQLGMQNRLGGYLSHGSQLYDPLLDGIRPKPEEEMIPEKKKFGFGTMLAAFVGFLLLKAAWPKIKPLIKAALAEFKSVGQ